MICNHDAANSMRIAKYAGKKLLSVFVIVAIGVSLIYFSRNAATAICVGISYLITIAAIIVVMIADDYERRLKLRFKAARS
jgi:hypothetical protein